jgi:hypothetical protein
VRDNHQRDRGPGAQPVQRPLHRVPRRLVQRRGRLIEEQDARLQCEGTRQHHPLLLTDRESGGIPVLERGVEPRQLEAASRVEAVTGQAWAVGDVVVDAALHQSRQLRHQADLAAKLQRVVLAHVRTLVQHPTGVRVGEPVEQAQQRRLAASRGTQEGAGAHRQAGANVPEHDLPATRVGYVVEVEEHLPIIRRGLKAARIIECHGKDEERSGPRSGAGGADAEPA